MPESVSIPATFARQAAEWLREGEIGRALGLCVAGTREYPDYATGHFVLGKCYEALGRVDDALAEYRRALDKLPDNPAILDQIARLRERAAKGRSSEAQPRPPRQNVQQASGRDTASGQQRKDEATAFDILARRLEEQRRRRAGQPAAAEETPPSSDITQHTTGSDTARDPGIVTPTMAEIYARQGAYAQALEAYRALAARFPNESSYASRIKELEVLAAKEGESKKKAP